jgi:hypothetical protein
MNLKDMKITSLLVTAGIALTALAINASASDALLSPRARDNQAKAATPSTVDPNLTAGTHGVSVSARAAGLQAKSTVATEVLNPGFGTCAIASPKQAERIGKTASASCCQPAETTVACTAPKACCGAK